MESRTAFLLDGRRVEPVLNRITHGAGQEQVQPRVMAVLVALAEADGEVVSREALLDMVWHDVVVNEDVLTTAISKLRRIFDDDPREPRVIETIYKTGYRLVAPVLVPDAPSPPLLPDAAPIPLDRRRENEAGHGGRRRLVFGGAVALLVLTFATLAFIRGERPRHATAPQSVPVTAFPGAESNPALSPDGRQVAYVYWSADTPGTADLYVKQEGSERPRRLTEHAGREGAPAWSPDGLRLAFVRRGEGCGLYVMPSLGGAEQRLTGCAETGDWFFHTPAWSPDGDWIVYAERAHAGAPFVLHALHIETRAQHTLLAPPAGSFGDHQPAFSPDGATLAFVRSRDGRLHEDLYIVPLDRDAPHPDLASDPVALTADDRLIAGFAWLPSGEELVFSSERNGHARLWTVAAEECDCIRGPLPLAGSELAEPTISGDTGQLVYVERRIDFNIWRLHHAEAGWTSERLLASSRYDLTPALSPDGATVAFVSDRGGTLEVWLSRADGTEARPLTQLGGAIVSDPSWSPDGQRVAFAASDGQGDLYVIDASGGVPQRLTHDEADDLTPAWSADGRTLYFSSNRSGTWQLWQITPDAPGEPVQVTTRGGYAPQPGPAGDAVYYVKRDAGGIWRTGPSREEELLADVRTDAWRVGADGIYVVTKEGSALGVIRYGFDGRRLGTAAPLEAMPYGTPFGLALGPQRRQMLFARIDQWESDLMQVALAEVLGTKGAS